MNCLKMALCSASTNVLHFSSAKRFMHYRAHIALLLCIVLYCIALYCILYTVLYIVYYCIIALQISQRYQRRKCQKNTEANWKFCLHGKYKSIRSGVSKFRCVRRRNVPKRRLVRKSRFVFSLRHTAIVRTKSKRASVCLKA